MSFELEAKQFTEIIDEWIWLQKYDKMPPSSNKAPWDIPSELRKHGEPLCRFPVEAGIDPRDVFVLMHDIYTNRRIDKRYETYWFRVKMELQTNAVQATYGPRPGNNVAVAQQPAGVSDLDETVANEADIPADCRDDGLPNGKPLTIEFVSRPETHNLPDSYLSKNYKGPRLKWGRQYVYRHAEIAALSNRKSRRIDS